MNSDSRLSFVSLFERVEAVEIPIIQRDYAQGRSTARDIRVEFLESIFTALEADQGSNSAELDLDFVYGCFEKGVEGVFSVLDGQQRLTTLFLLHWYLSAQDDELVDFRDKWVLNDQSRFRYSTRPSSGEFFDSLVKADIDISGDLPEYFVLSEIIQDSQWFSLSWKLDPTVRSCLVVLDEIHRIFKSQTGLYPNLIEDKPARITFQFLNLKEFGLSDELYIKMNARGKPLTAFENFKAWLVGKTKDKSWAAVFDAKMDQEWLDFFWTASQENGSSFDDLFLRFFHVMAFFTACEELGGRYSYATTDKKIRDWLNTTRTAQGTIPLRLFEEHDSFTDTVLQRVSNVLEFIVDHASSTQQEAFVSVLRSSDYVELAKFFALVQFVEMHCVEEGVVSVQSDQLRQWVRVTDNLLHNMRLDEMPPFVSALKGLTDFVGCASNLYTSLADMDKWNFGFSRSQGKEEIRKAKLIAEDPDWESALTDAENHDYLRGKVGFLLDICISDGEIPDMERFTSDAKKVHTLFSRDVLTSSSFLLQRALISLGNYLVPQAASYKYSFCKANRGTYRERDDNWLHVAEEEVFSELVGKLTDDVEGSLRKIIANSSCAGWRQLFVTQPELILYCWERLIHREDSEFLLLRKSRLSGYHAELNSYALFCRLQSQFKQSGRPDFIKRIEYKEVYGYDVPGISITTDQAEPFLLGFKNEKWVWYHSEEGKEVPDALFDFIDALTDA